MKKGLIIVLAVFIFIIAVGIFLYFKKKSSTTSSNGVFSLSDIKVLSDTEMATLAAQSGKSIANDYKLPTVDYNSLSFEDLNIALSASLDDVKAARLNEYNQAILMQKTPSDLVQAATFKWVRNNNSEKFINSIRIQAALESKYKSLI